MQSEVSKINGKAWNVGAYNAWLNRFGTPKDYAAEIKMNPISRNIHHFLDIMGDIRGKKVANLLGSNGNKAVPLAMLGADVTVVDISEENARYATELAREAEVSINYIVSDVMEFVDDDKFDFVLMEGGILHYFVDLNALFTVVSKLLVNGGRFILRDYHPTRKLLSCHDGQMIASGNYFKDTIYDDGIVPYIHLLSEEEQEHSSMLKLRLRSWNMGEIITAIASSGLTIRSLQEEHGEHLRWVFPSDAPEGIENRAPSLFTVVADKV